jgi:ribosomal protein S2
VDTENKVQNNTKRCNANTAEGVAMRASAKRDRQATKQRKKIKEMDSAPDIGIEVDGVSEPDALNEAPEA